MSNIDEHLNGRLTVSAQARRKNFWTLVGTGVGVLLGFGAPAGSLLARMLYSRSPDPEWAFRELSANAFYYSYMTLLTPLVFGLFGRWLGALNDRVLSQNKALESLMLVLESKSMTDDVTGLYNHRQLLDEIDKEVERKRRRGGFLSGIMVDVDGFKQVNDLHGHLAGDGVLRELALVLNQSIRKIDIIGRYGGDEFIIVLPDTHQEAAELVCERILRNVREHRFRAGREYIGLTVSLGLFCFNDAADLDKDRFIEKIDQAMFRAKSYGKDRMFAV